MIEAVRLIVTDKQIPEVGILQHSLKASQTLFQYFFAMGDKEYPARAARIFLAEALVIKSGNNCFAGTGGGHDQIFKIATHMAIASASGGSVPNNRR